MGEEANSYEEARRQRVQENLKQLECFGISKISKSLHEAVNCKKLLKSHASPKVKKNLGTVELRRSVRERNTVSSYVEMYQDKEIINHRRYTSRSSRTGTRSSNLTEYNGRIASAEQQIRAMKIAEELQDDLEPDNLSFIKQFKPMVRPHDSSYFWLGLPRHFCKEHLPDGELRMVLEDEDDVECNVTYIGDRTGLRGGWKGFAVRHGLEDGDVLVFELIERRRFKIYIVKAIEDDKEQSSQENETEVTSMSPKRMTRSMEKKKELPVPKRPLTRQATKTTD